MSEKTIRGLLIEDDPDDALLFMNHMKVSRGPGSYSFEHATTLTQGLDVLSRGGIDVVLLDVMLPDSRGLETVQKLRAWYPDVPVVVLTGLSDENVGIEALRVGAQDYQVKGHVDGRALKRTIGYAVERHRMLTDLRRVDQLKAEIREQRAMDQLKDDLMSTVSHEMRNPLTVIKVVASGLKETLKGVLTKQQADMLSMQYRNILRLEKIIGRILDLSRLESGKATITRQAVDVPQLVTDIVQGFVMMDKNPRVKIVEEVSPGLPRVDADPDLFVQVLNNLIDNGTRFAHSRVAVRAEPDPGDGPPPPARPAGGGVAVSAATGFVRFSVSDDGEGIPQERIPDLFNKFVQVNRSAKGEGYKGTGLGLAICKEIVERHGGRIWVESAEGLGSAFRFTLPVHAGA
ncbi:MAG: hybrid sensor histidine kinase/response regulator [Elusimicrobiota bacterium]|nr:MAG: hybrid sensor histidine kinase/response regulator [Elusimicrobiota bacterium]